MNRSLIQSLNKSISKEYKELYINSDECLIIDDNLSESDNNINLVRNSSNENIILKKIMCDKSTNTDNYFNSNQHITQYQNINNKSKNDENCSCIKLLKRFFNF